jgi:hypothetical protein
VLREGIQQKQALLRQASHERCSRGSFDFVTLQIMWCFLQIARGWLGYKSQRHITLDAT